MIKPASLKRVVVDTTVQEKNIAYPTDSRLYDQSRKQLVGLAYDLGITLRQTYQKACRKWLPQISRYAHARQFKRMRKALKKVKGYLGRVYRDLFRRLPAKVQLTLEQQTVLRHAKRLLAQTRSSKNKLYSLHACLLYTSPSPRDS